MTCDYAFLCDYAADRGGHVTAVGIGFGQIMARQLPAAHPQFFLVAQVRATAQELGTKQLALRLVDDEGQQILGQEGTVTFAPVEGGGDSIARLVVGFYLVNFPRFGVYTFQLLIDNQELSRQQFHVVHLP